MSTRAEQVASMLRAAVQRVLSRGLNDPRVRGLISVTAVDISPDLRDARVHVSILPQELASLTMHGLRAAASHVRSDVARHVRLRSVPRLEFVLDESLKRQAAIEEAIRAGLPGDDASDPCIADDDGDVES